MNVFDNLPAYLQRKIDRAFDTIRKSSSLSNDISTSEHLGGGFIAEGSDGDLNDEQVPTQMISMADIPTALQSLDLAPDDEQVLAVFRNAASGWNASSSKDLDDTSGGWVSREDWRSVCAVLLEHYQEEYQDDSDRSTSSHKKELDVASDDQYVESGSDSDDDYVEERSTTTRRNTRQSIPKQKDTSPALATGLTERQQKASLEAFALFFPDVSTEAIPQQKIMIKDIQRVATLLGEKIKADEVLEMIDAFTTSSDKSIGLDDFSRIMVAARLA